MVFQEIEYTDKVDLDETQVADINKTKASDLNEIKSVVNNNKNCLEEKLTYSTNEINTGKKWINNKPIYRQVVRTDNFAVPTTSSYLPSALKPTNESDIEEITYTEVTLKDSQYSVNIAAQISKMPDGIKIIAIDGWSAGTNRYITIVYEYTKSS